MQCKARGRPCTFSKDGLLDPDQEKPKEQGPVEAGAPQTDTLDLIEDESVLFADSNEYQLNRSKRRALLHESRVSKVLASFGDDLRKLSINDSYPKRHSTGLDIDPFGNFIQWMPDPPLPTKYTGSVEMPSRDIQMNLISIFFDERYEITPMISKRHFYDQLDKKGPLITPLLLNSIYMHTCKFTDLPDVPKTDVFFHRAKRLLEDFLDVPRVSTVVALMLMSQYEPSPNMYRSGAQQCRSWMYSGMAFRMCLELGLNTESNISKDLSQEEIETRRRVFWSCYCLDKFQSSGWERPWMIPVAIANTELPNVLPQDDPKEQGIVEGLRAKLELVLASEEGLSLRACAALHGIADKNAFFTRVREFQDKLIVWLRALPPSLQWTLPAATTIEEVIHLPRPRPMLCHLHLIYNLLLLDILMHLPGDAENLFQRRIRATHITQLVHHMCVRPATIIKFDYAVHSTISAIKVHAKHVYDNSIAVSQQSLGLYDQSIMVLREIRKYAIIPNADKILQHVPSTPIQDPAGDTQPHNDITYGASPVRAGGFTREEMSSEPQPLTTTTSTTTDNMSFMEDDRRHESMDGYSTLHGEQRPDTNNYVVLSMHSTPVWENISINNWAPSMMRQNTSNISYIPSTPADTTTSGSSPGSQVFKEQHYFSAKFANHAPNIKSLATHTSSGVNGEFPDMMISSHASMLHSLDSHRPHANIDLSTGESMVGYPQNSSTNLGLGVFHRSIHDSVMDAHHHQQQQQQQQHNVYRLDRYSQQGD
ncbi:hypothetical protein DFQ28_008009 [Apophysomyces sp. BC1034]|nr:hypothetical protein DFQ30_007271 [Apophysomyces sp. BC1015]KAG0192765.1 hypothetical protein DFQ28_008009 [Apophysomyces sp. BC1034]